MRRYIACVTAFFAHPVPRYGQVLFLLVAITALQLEMTATAILLFVILYLCRFPLAYDIIAVPVMLTALLTLRTRPAGAWFPYVFAAYAVLELLKFSPFLLARYLSKKGEL